MINNILSKGKILFGSLIVILGFLGCDNENVDPTLPKPLEFKASKGEYGNKVMLTWHLVPGATSYQVFKQDSASLKYLLIGRTDSTQFEDVNIEKPLAEYFYKVRAYNSKKVVGDFSEYDYGYSNGKPYDLIRSFGTEGTQLNEFGLVVHIAYRNKALYLADWYNQWIVKYNPDGSSPELVYQLFGDPTGPYFYDDQMIVGWGETQKIRFIKGTNEVKSFSTPLLSPMQITVDNNNFIYITAGNKVTKYDMDGNQILQWGTKGDQPGQFNSAWGIVYYHNVIVVSNYMSGKVQFFSTNGEFIKEWTLANACFDLYIKDDYLYVACGTFIAKTDYEGTVIEKIYGDFTSATSMAIDEQQNIYVTDPYQRKIYVYRKN